MTDDYMSIYTTEITSATIASDNPVHQRLLSAYMFVKDKIHGDLLEIGCGDGRGVEILSPLAASFTALDKNKPLMEKLQQSFPQIKFLYQSIPPLEGIKDNSFDTIVSFQVIEHIKDDSKYLEEIRRVLKPGGRAYITTPNIKFSLTRNPWHVREYTAEQLLKLCKKYFDLVEAKGIHGNEKVMRYYEQNKVAVKKITRYDVLNLQYRLPRRLLQIPYDILNRMNRDRLLKEDSLAASICYTDYFVSDKPEDSLDLFYTLIK